MKILAITLNMALEAEGKPVEPLPEKPKHTSLFVSNKPYSEPEGGWVAYLLSLELNDALTAINSQFMGRPELAEIMDKEFHANPEFLTVHKTVQVSVAMCGSHFRDAFKAPARAEFLGKLAAELWESSPEDAKWVMGMV